MERQEIADQLEELIDEYWCIAYQEGLEARTHDTEDGIAARTRSKIMDCIARLAE